MLGVRQPGSVLLSPCKVPSAISATHRGGPQSLQARSSRLQPPRLAGLPPIQTRRRVAACSGSGREPGWDEWDAETDFVAEASSAAADAAGWGPLQQLRARRQQNQQHQAATNTHALSGVSDVPAHRHAVQQQAIAAHAIRPPQPPQPPGSEVRFFTFGAIAAVALHYLINFTGTLPVVRRFLQRFVWWYEPKDPSPPSPPASEPNETRTRGSARAAVGGGTSALAMQYSEDEESVEWVNMCWRKAWRVYQRGIERWLADLLQPLFDSLVEQKMVPSFVQRLRIMEFTLDHEAPYFTNMRRRTSRKDSDLNGVVDVRYTGGARMLLLIEVGTGRWRIKIPVMVSDLDLESKLWLKIRLAPMCPWIGTLGLGFVGAPSIKVQLNPYNRIRLMKVPILQAFLTKLLTKDLPALITLPQRLEINIPPAVTAVAEAAVGRDAVMRAVASAVLQADALEHALLAALPLGPQGAAGGVSLPDLFQGELQVTLHEARDLPVWGFPWQSNPYCRITLGSQAVQSRRDDDTSHAGRHRAPVWNQDFQFLVEDPTAQSLDIWIGDSPMTGRTEVGRASFPLSQLASDGTADVWLPVDGSMMPGEKSQLQGAVRLVMSYKPFQEDEVDSGYRAAAAFGSLGQQQSAEITDVKSAADASSRAAVAASAAAAAVAVTKAAAARAAARIARGAALAGQPQGFGQSQQGGGSSSSSSASSSDGNLAAQNGSQLLLQQQPQPQRGSPGGSAGGVGSLPGVAGAATSDSGGDGASTPADKSPVETAAAVASTVAKAISPTASATVVLDTSAEPASGSPHAAGSEPSATGGNGNGTDASAARSSARETAVQQLTTMAATMQRLTAEVDGIVHSGGGSSSSISFSMDADVKLAAVEAVAAAEAAAISAVAAGDLAGANRVLEDAAATLQSTVAELTAAESGAAELRAAATSAAPEADSAAGGGGAADAALRRAREALAAAHAAAAQAADAAAVARAASEAVDDAQQSPASDDDEGDEGSDFESAAVAAAGLDAAPSTEAAAARARGLPSYDSDGNILPQEPHPAWWLSATQYVPGVPRTGDSEAAEGAAADADGGAGSAPRGQSAAAVPSLHQQHQQHQQQQAQQQQQPGLEPLADVKIPADLPLDDIAAEVLKSWKLRDTRVEALVQKAVEARRKQQERPWVQLLGVMATVSAVLLAVVLWRLQHMPV